MQLHPRDRGEKAGATYKFRGWVDSWERNLQHSAKVPPNRPRQKNAPLWRKNRTHGALTLSTNAMRNALLERTPATHFSNTFTHRSLTPPSRTAQDEHGTHSRTAQDQHDPLAQHSRHSEAGNKVEKTCVRKRRTAAEGITHRQRRRSKRSENVSQRKP
jgi:hypothetical protein